MSARAFRVFAFHRGPTSALLSRRGPDESRPLSSAREARLDMDKDTALQLTALRWELKRWQHAFAAANGGRKPSREDIKSDATIAAKHVAYNELQKALAKAGHVETPRKHKLPHPGNQHERAALKERNANTTTRTPSKTLRHAQSLESVVEEGDEEEDEGKEQTPAFIRHALGPTPQKDGQVLGIFDMACSATPTKASLDPSAAAISFVSGTPSKTAAAAPSDPALSKTPQSSGKRFFLDAFAGTPLKRKREDEACTPSTARRQYHTPSFLRRSFPLATVDEETADGAPLFKKRGLVRSLSKIIKGLRKQEDKRMDDEWDIMNEIEREEQEDSAPKVLVEDSQATEMPLGPDQAQDGSDDDSSGPEQIQIGANGQPRKPWKKKGLKRQTKRVIMRPVLHKPKKAQEGEADDSETGVVAETQGADTAHSSGHDLDHGKEGSDFDDDDQTKEAMSAKAKSDGKAADKQKAPKKVSAQAHANFRRLKIKNKNSKANGRGGKRFGRR